MTNSLPSAGNRETDDLAGLRIIRERECAQITGLGRTTRWKLMRDGRFPAKVSHRDAGVSGWRAADVQNYLRTCTG